MNKRYLLYTYYRPTVQHLGEVSHMQRWMNFGGSCNLRRYSTRKSQFSQLKRHLRTFKISLTSSSSSLLFSRYFTQSLTAHWDRDLLFAHNRIEIFALRTNITGITPSEQHLPRFTRFVTEQKTLPVLVGCWTATIRFTVIKKTRRRELAYKV